MKKNNANSVENYVHNYGYCVLCEQPAIFVEIKPWLRDFYMCTRCLSIPRQRAIVNALNTFIPSWRKLKVHESSPGGILSDYLKKELGNNYSSSHYYKDIARGEYYDGSRSEDLCSMTFPDNSFDVFITSDVFEHVFTAEKAFKEISRVLKPDGKHVFTTPWKKELPKTIKRAEIVKGKTVHHKRKEYHGNPINKRGSLVTYDYGLDFIDFIYKSSGLSTITYLEKNRDLGLDAEFLEVFISQQ